MPGPTPTRPRGERTRRAILEAAEILFARKGFAGTRLEDVAGAVGIRRPSILYYFPDKAQLYDAVLSDVMGGLLDRIRGALEAPGALPDRILAAISAWVDYVAERPALARLLLREVADGSADEPPPLVRHTRPFLEMVEKVLEREPSESLSSLHAIDPVHLASTVCGATVFLVSGMPALLPDMQLDPLSRTQIETHRREVLSIARRLLTERNGLTNPR